MRPDPRDKTISRRDAMRLGLGSAAGLILGDRLSPAMLCRSEPKAKAVIQIWMWGGPSHLDTFDPKPLAGEDYTGPLKNPVPTNVDGIQIGELLPLLARQADKYALLRSMTHGINAHETAAYMVQTGHQPGGRLVYPSAGAVVSLFKGYEAGYRGLIPPYIVLTRPQGRFSEAGFLGLRHKPFATGGDPAKTPFVVEGVVAEGISPERQRSRRELLRSLDTMGRALADTPQIDELNRAADEAYDLILGDAGKVFALQQESDAVRESYGRNSFGQSCLMARRLVERGVPYVTINYRGWDTHKQHFQSMRRMLPEFDRGLSTLLGDLSQRGLLDSTIVWCGGEFGRGPKVQWAPPWNGGRSHWGRVFTTLVAGGGFRGGQVVGASDERGYDVAERPIEPRDLLGAIYEQLDIDSTASLPNGQGLDIPVLAPRDENSKGGRLKEIL